MGWSMLNNKRGAVELSLKWLFFRLVIVLFISVFLIVVVWVYLSEDFSKMHALEAIIFTRALQHTCLAVQDDLRSYPGVIDPAKLTHNKLKACFWKESLGYRVELLDRAGRALASAEVVTPQQKEYALVCASENAFYTCSTRRDYVVYQSGNERLPGFLQVWVISHV